MKPSDIEDPRPRRPLLRWGLTSLAAALLALGAWTGWRVASGKTSPPQFTRQSADRALAELRRDKAERWAPGPSRAAESLYRDATLEYRREQEKLVFVRDYDEARAMLRRAEDALRQALRVAVKERDEQRTEATDAIERATAIVDSTREVSQAVVLGKYEQMLLQRSQLALKEAQLLFAREDFVTATQRADLAGLQAARLTDKAARVAARFTDPAQVRSWKRMIDDTIDWSRRTGGVAVIVSKESHSLTVYDDGRPAKTYRAELGFNSAHDKVYAGDNATPEGRYRVIAKKPASGYYKALLLNYPNEEDRANFARLRRTGELPKGVSPGGLIEVHGEGGRGRDWTNGCVALTNREMDELFARVGVGTPVTIVGSDGNAGTYTNIVRMHKQSGGTRAD